MLRITNLTKTYPNGTKALNDINVTIGSGVFGLLGPNGSGKSSLMRTIATLQEPDYGTIQFGEMDVLNSKEQMRTVLGYLPQEFGVYPTISAENLLHHLAVLKGIVDGSQRKSEVDRLLEMTNLSQYRKKKLGSYSGGMKQRFGIAQALLGNPKIIIVDEPTAGLDPIERDRFHQLLNLVGEEITVILSTHIVSDVSELCNEMAILHQGRVLMQMSPKAAIETLQGKIWAAPFSQSEAEFFAKTRHVISSKLLHGKCLMKIYSDTNPGSPFTSIEPSLEDVYFYQINGI
ncbi:MAG: multidrug transporter ATP-binding protein [Parachlamydiales bacterium]|nr:multidrug transporter ATP-binding protein [Parachlamydiales bacterium]